MDICRNILIVIFFFSFTFSYSQSIDAIKKKNEKTLVIDFIFRNLFLFESGYCPCDNEKQIF